MRSYVFKVIVQSDPELGLNDACDVHDLLEEVIRDQGLDSHVKVQFDKKIDEDEDDL